MDDAQLTMTELQEVAGAVDELELLHKAQSLLDTATQAGVQNQYVQTLNASYQGQMAVFLELRTKQHFEDLVKEAVAAGGESAMNAYKADPQNFFPANRFESMQQQAYGETISEVHQVVAELEQAVSA